MVCGTDKTESAFIKNVVYREIFEPHFQIEFNDNTIIPLEPTDTRMDTECVFDCIHRNPLSHSKIYLILPLTTLHLR